MSAVQRPAAVPERPRRPALPQLMSETAAVTLVAAAFFWVAYDSGSFTLVSRTSLAIVVWWLIGVGWVVRLWPPATPPPAAVAIAALLAALAGWTALSMAWASNGQASFEEITRTLLYLGVFVLVVLAAPLVRPRVWTDALALALGAVAVAALLSRLFPGTFTSDAQYRFLPFGQARLNYPVGYWNGLAILVMLGVPFQLRAAVGGRSVISRAAAVGVLPVAAAVVYLASSRGGVAVGAVAVVASVALTPRRVHTLTAAAVGGVAAGLAVATLRSKPELVNDPGAAVVASQGRHAAPVILLVAVLGAVLYALVDLGLLRRRTAPRWMERAALVGMLALLAIGVVASHPRQRFAEFRALPAASVGGDTDYVGAHLASMSGNGRWQYWEEAYHQFRAHPLLGGGAGSYAEWWSQHRPIASFVLDAHSLYLEALGELGVVGFVLVAALACTALFVAVARPLTLAGGSPTAAALGAAVCGFLVALGVDWMWELTAVSVVGLASLALLAVARPWRPAEYLSWASVRTAAAVVATGVIAIEAVPLIATQELARSANAVKAGDAGAALDAAHAARRIEPWAFAPRLQGALVLEQLGELEPARSEIRAAIDRAPRNWQLWLVKARLDVESGHVRAARAALARVRELNPLGPVPPSPAP